MSTVRTKLFDKVILNEKNISIHAWYFEIELYLCSSSRQELQHSKKIIEHIFMRYSHSYILQRYIGYRIPADARYLLTCVGSWRNWEAIAFLLLYQLNFIRKCQESMKLERM